MAAQHIVAGIIDAKNAFTWVSGKKDPGQRIDYDDLSKGDVLIYNGGPSQSIIVEDGDTDAFFYAQDSGQKTVGDFTIDGTTYPSGTLINLSYQATFEDPATGNRYILHTGGLQSSNYNVSPKFYIWDPAKGTPPNGTQLRVVDEQFTGALSYSSVTCFTTGTMIETMAGLVPVEGLKVGDAVRTLDNGYQKIRWIGSKEVTGGELARNPKLLPMRIKAGTVGQGLPERDLYVSRQHRVLIRSKIAQRMFGTSEILVPVIQLACHEGIEIAKDIENVTYWHILFDKHEIIFSEGAPTESLFTGPQALKSMSPEAREELEMLFPEIMDPDFAPYPARPLQDKRKAIDRLVERHKNNGQPLLR